MSDRDDMLKRIRTALGRPDPSPGAAFNTPEFPPLENVVPGVSDEKLIDKFEEELKRAGGIAHRVDSSAELDRILAEICLSAGAGPLVFSRNPLISQLDLQARLEAEGYHGIAWPREGDLSPEGLSDFRSQCFSSAVGITGVNYALAESGSLVLTSRAEGCQLVSLAPPVHVALYLREQVVGSLEEALEGVYGAADSDRGGSGRSVVFVTGPSATADIEQIKIRGVHGPQAVHAVLVTESCLK